MIEMKFIKNPETGLLIPEKNIRVYPSWLAKMDLQHFAEIFNINGENAGSTPWEFDSLSEEGSNTIALNAAAKCHGDYGYRITFDGTNDVAYGVIGFSEQGDMYVRKYIKIPSTFDCGGAFSEIRTLGLYDGGTWVCGMGFKTEGAGPSTWLMRYRFTSLTDNTNFTMDTWHYIDFYFNNDAAAGGCTMWVDGDQILTDMDQDSSAYLPDSAQIGSIYCGNPPSADDYFDIDTILADTSGPIGPYGGGGSIVPLLSEQRRRRT